MKNYIGLALITILLVCHTAFTAQEQQVKGEVESVIAALKAGNATQLAEFFDTRIDLTLPDKSDNYSRSQAAMIIKDFFANTGIKTFELKHQGENNGSKYAIGILQTKLGNYRTKFFMKPKDQKQVVQEISFQAE